MAVTVRLENQAIDDGSKQMTQQAREIFNRRYGELIKAKTFGEIDAGVSGLYSFASKVGDKDALDAAARVCAFYYKMTENIDGKTEAQKADILGKIKTWMAQTGNPFWQDVEAPAPPAKQTAAASQTSTVSVEASDAQRKQVRVFVDDLLDNLRNMRSPRSYYPEAILIKEGELPLAPWAAQLYDKYNKLNSYLNEKEKGLFDKLFVEELGKRDLTPEQRAVLESLMKRGDDINFKSNLKVLARTQMAMDGLSLVFQSAHFGRTISEMDLKIYFKEEVYGKDLVARILKFNRNTSEAETRELVNEIFTKIVPGNANPEAAKNLMNLVVESSFAENASALKWQIEKMNGKFNDAPGSATENLKEYYALLSGENGIGSKGFNAGWESIRKSDKLYDRMFERQMATSVGPQRGIFDISLVAGMAFAASSGSRYFKSASFENTGVQFFDIITGAGAYAPQAALTMLKNTDVIDFAYKTFSNRTDDFLGIMASASTSVARVYSNPMGTEFNSVIDGRDRPATRFEAADMLVQAIGTRKGNQMLDYLTQTYLQLDWSRAQSYIKIRTLYELVMVGGQYMDNDNLRDFINKLNIEGSPWNDPQGAYQKILKFVEDKPPSFLQSQINDISTYVKAMPSTYIYGLDVLYTRLVKRTDASRPRGISTNASGSGNSLVNPNREQEKIWGTGSVALNVQTTTGNITNGFDFRTDIDKDLGTTNSNAQMKHYWAQINELRSRQLDLASLIFDIRENVSTKDEKDKAGVTTQTIDYNSAYMGSMRASGFGNLYIIVDGNNQSSITKPDVTKPDKEKKTGPGYDHIEVIYSQDGQYYKTIIARESLAPGDLERLNKAVTGYQAVLEQYQCLLPAGDIAVGEYQKRPDFSAGTLIHTNASSTDLISKLALGPENANIVKSADFKVDDIVTIKETVDGKDTYYIIKKTGNDLFEAYKATPVEPTDRAGFVIGLQDKSERAAGLFALTPEGGQLAMGAARIKKNKEKNYVPGKINGVVVMGGYIYYNSSDQTDLVGRESWRQNEPNIGPSAFSTPTKRLYTASVMTNNLFATALASEEYGAGMARMEDFGAGSFGVGGLIKWSGEGAGNYMINGQYNYQDKYKVGFISQVLPEYESSSGRAELDLGKGYKLVLYGSYGELLNRQGSMSSQTFTELSEQAKELEDKIKKATQDPNWKTDANAASDVRSWASEMISIMNQLDVRNIGDAFGYTTNQYSVGLVIPGEGKSPASEVKFSLAELKNQDGSKQGYITNMTCVKLSKEKEVYLSFTAGVPIYKKDAPAEATVPSANEFDKSIENFGGAKLDLGNVAFGVAGYNAGKANQAIEFSAGWVNKKAGFIQEAGGKAVAMEKGYEGTFTIGNDRVKLHVTKGKVQGADEWSVAQVANFPLSNAAALMFQAEYRNIRMEDLKSNEARLQGTYTIEDGLSFNLQGWKNWYKKNEIRGSDWGFNVGFSYVF